LPVPTPGPRWWLPRWPKIPVPPRLFGATDLPQLTASGLPVSALSALPWPLRRPVAEAPTLAAAYVLCDKYAGAPDLVRA
jgi:hypothetical protein